MLFGGGAFVGAWGAYVTDTAITEAGHKAQAVIASKDHFGPTIDTSDEWNIAYHFNLPDGRTLEAHRGISQSLWSSLEKGSEITVLYSAEKPSRNFPVGEGNTSIAVCIYMNVIGAAFIFTGIAITASGLGKGPKPIRGKSWDTP